MEPRLDNFLCLIDFNEFWSGIKKQSILTVYSRGTGGLFHLFLVNFFGGKGANSRLAEGRFKSEVNQKLRTTKVQKSKEN